jgi:nicotinamidase-related amidase
MTEVPPNHPVTPLELPAPHTALVVVDMQNDFVDPQGSLFVPAAPATLPAVAQLLQTARQSGVKVVYTQDWHTAQDPEFALWPPHAVQDTWGAQIVPQLQPEPGDTLIKKLRYDGFYGTSLDHLLRLWDIQYLVIMGTVANICVLSTASSAALRWYRVVVPTDGISALNEFDHALTLRQVEFLYQGQLTQCREVRFV